MIIIYILNFTMKKSSIETSKAFSASLLSTVFSEKCGKIERMEEIYGITKK